MKKTEILMSDLALGLYSHKENINTSLEICDDGNIRDKHQLLSALVIKRRKLSIKTFKAF